MLLNQHGGIIDDTMITKHSDEAFYVVTNAGTRDKDLAWFRDKLAEWNTSERAKEGPVEHEVLENWGLIALQGALCVVRCALSSSPYVHSDQVPRLHNTCRHTPLSTSMA